MTTTPLALRRMRAITRAIDPPDDLLDALGPGGFAWLRDGRGFVTSGIAARVCAHDAVALLGDIDHQDEVARSGVGPLAVGALPFAPGAEGSLVIPARVIGRDEFGHGWITELDPEPQAAIADTSSPEHFTVSETTSAAGWKTAVDTALVAIDRGELDKVVLARRVEVTADRPFDLRTVLARLRAQQPDCFVYADGDLVGATPELLLRRVGTTLTSQPMAGSAGADDPIGLARLAASAKDAREHRPVVDAIVATLAPLCSDLAADDEPVIVHLATIAHLASRITGTLRSPAPDALTIARALHPTPAVGGVPLRAALEAIDRLEDAPRGRYAGPVGWVDARGDGEWAVALRGATIDGATALLHAGAGIVAGSVAADEWRETEAKLAPMMRALTGS